MMTISTLSILIPTYNDLCVKLVGNLRQQAEDTGITYEILVADDGSTDKSVIQENRQINQFPNCRYIERPHNSGRASIRNFLANEARYEWLLYIDSDMSVMRGDYIIKYVSHVESDVVDGGVSIGGDADALKTNLRYVYEKSAENEHTVEMRRNNPYKDFHTANFLIRRTVMLGNPFDERFRYYGYEDVLFGKVLKQKRIAIAHIDNPLEFNKYEDNPLFISKTEEGLRTLHQFSDELKGYSRLLTFIEGVHIPFVLSIIRYSHKLFGGIIRKRLCGSHPDIRLFSLYRLGYYLTLK